MSFGLPFRLALRELRGGLGGFRVFLLCLALGVAAIAAVGLVRAGIERGLAGQGAVLLGGDAEMAFTYRKATAEERAWMAAHAAKVSEIIDFRSMAVAGNERALTQVKAVDDAWPLVGQVGLSQGTLAAALAVKDGTPGAVMEKVLADRLGLKIGSVFRMGTQDFHLGAILTLEPDTATTGFALGPRTIVRTRRSGAVGSSGAGDALLEPLPAVAAARREPRPAEGGGEGGFCRQGHGLDRPAAGDAGAGALRRPDGVVPDPGGAGRAGRGRGRAWRRRCRAYLEAKTASIATLRVLGAEGGLIFRLYLIQIGVLAGLGILGGLVLACVAIWLAGPLIAAALPFPAPSG